MTEQKRRDREITRLGVVYALDAYALIDGLNLFLIRKCRADAKLVAPHICGDPS